MKSRSFADKTAGFGAHDAIAAAVIVAILYGSLYPFSFFNAGSLWSAFLHLMGTWRTPSQSRGDTLANLLLYMPVGLAVSLALIRRGTGYTTPIIALGVGTLLSFSIELVQNYDASRVSTLSDVYLNVFGTLAGVIIAVFAKVSLSKVLLPMGNAPTFARLLLLAWVGWRLYPYVPTVDLHKYWNSLKPLIFASHVAPYGIFRYATLWLSVIFLVQTGLQPRNPVRLLVPMFLFFLVAKVLVIGQVLLPTEVLGGMLALLVGPFVLRERGKIGTAVLTALFLALVISPRLLPWQLAAVPHPFQWIPFFGFLHGVMQINIISFAEKFYLYGVVLLLLLKVGMALRWAVVLECTLLLGTSLFQVFLVDRSAEITDTIMALALGALYAVLTRSEREAALNSGRSA